MKVDPTARLKDPKDYTIESTSVPRRDIPAKIFGTFSFVHDHKLPGMLHARVVHPAAVGATLERWNDDTCKKIPGYVRAVRKGNFLAVVATDEWAAISASTAIDASWSGWAGLPEESKLFEWVRNAKVNRTEVLQSTGTASEAPKPGSRTLQATYDMTMNTHGSIGPSSRDRRPQGRLSHGLDPHAGLPSAASATRHHAADATGARPLYFLWRGRAAMAGMAPMTALPKQL